MSQSLTPFSEANITQTWSNLSVERKIAIAALVVVAVAAAVFFATWSQQPDFVAAFSDVSAEDGAKIVDYLKEQNIPYEISEGGGSIRVPASQVHEVRLALAAEGLPGRGSVGFELFDTTSLGMTDFTQQVNYQRALEGELARTIGSLKAVKSARVHIVMPQPSLFKEDQLPTTTDVVVELSEGQKLAREQVRAISHLVSSAVEGLSPDNLTVVDMDGNVLADGASSATTAAITQSQSQLDAQRAFERDLEVRIQSMLENVLGPDKAVVRVAAQMDWNQVTTEQEIFEPGGQGGVLRSSHQITETYSGSGAAAGGIPGTASNIPDAASSYETQVDSSGNGNGYQRSESTTNYEVSRSVSQIVSAAGEVKRLSVSVIVNDVTDQAKLDAVRQATIAAAGIDEANGDVLTVQSIPFDRSYYAEEEQAMAEVQQREFYIRIAKWAAIAIVLVALFFVVRGMTRNLTTIRATGEIVEDLTPGVALLQEMGPGTPAPVSLEQAVAAAAAAALPDIGPPAFGVETQKAAEKAQMLRQLQMVSKNRPATLAQIIQFWMAEED